MRTIILLMALAGVSVGVFMGSRAHTCCDTEISAGRCNPYGICKACTTCQYCKHCSQMGGSCSVCR